MKTVCGPRADAPIVHDREFRRYLFVDPTIVGRRTQGPGGDCLTLFKGRSYNDGQPERFCIHGVPTPAWG
jgi:hypothetical protein